MFKCRILTLTRRNTTYVTGIVCIQTLCKLDYARLSSIIHGNHYFSLLLFYSDKQGCVIMFRAGQVVVILITDSNYTFGLVRITQLENCFETL